MFACENLAVVIPVWDLPEDLSSLLNQIAEMKIFSEVIISDDCSSKNCHPTELGFSEENLGARLVYLRSSERRGAGYARNAGLKQVTAKNVLFFDADDRLNYLLPTVFHQHLSAGSPDFTIFRHSDTRVEAGEGREGTFAQEEALWDEALGPDVLKSMLPLSARAKLSIISAYPWNKIYRTDFLRKEGITCSETPVHNDIRLHWLSFIRAQTVLATRHIGAVHVISNRPHHLTTRQGEDRLCLSGIISELTYEIRNAPNKLIMMRQFIHFVDTICHWNLRQAEEHQIPKFIELAVNAYLGFNAEEFRMFAFHQPKRAKEIVEFLINKGA